MPSELSLVHAKAKFFEVTADERAIQLEHMKMLRAHIDECIERGKRKAVYVVPETLTGPFPLFEVPTMALWLVRQCKRGGFKTNLLSTDPYTIRVSGWCDEDWLDRDQPSFSPPIIVPRAPTKTKTKTKAKTKAKMSQQEASAMAQRGELGARLKYGIRRR